MKSFTTLAAIAGLVSSCAAPPFDAGPPRRATRPPQAGQAGPSSSSEAPDPSGDAALKQANNPLANMKALNFHNYAIRDVSGTDEPANAFWVRYAQPVGNWLVRASLPVNTVPTGMEESESGLGDGNVFASYLFDSGDPSVSYGIGPLLGLPTGTTDLTGTDQWSAGAAAVYFDARSSLVQYGGLVTYQHKFAGEDRAPDVNFLAVQPFGFLQLGGGLYLRNTGIWSFDLQSGNYAVPLGLGLGKVVKSDGIVFNFFLEPQFTILHDGPGQPEFQLFFGFNTQFLGG